MKIILGTAQIGLNYGVTNTVAKPSTDMVRDLMDLAYQSGILTVDSAEHYGNANQILGEYHINSGNVFNVINKILRYPCPQSKLGQYRIEVIKTLDRLSIEQYDTLMVHDYSLILQERYYSDFFQALKQEGLTRRIGVSVQSPDLVLKIADTFPVDVIQLPFNIFDQSMLHSGIMGELKQRGIEIHVRSVFLQGILLNELNSLPNYFQQYSSVFDGYDEVCLMHNLTKLEATLSFILTHPEVDCMVIGCQNKHELDEIVTTYKNILSSSIRGIDFNVLSQSDESLINPTKWLK